MNKGKNYSQEIFIISILTLTITFVWIYLSIYKASKNSEKPVLRPIDTQILDPKLDEGVFEALKERGV